MEAKYFIFYTTLFLGAVFFYLLITNYHLKDSIRELVKDYDEEPVERKPANYYFYLGRKRLSLMEYTISWVFGGLGAGSLIGLMLYIGPIFCTEYDSPNFWQSLCDSISFSIPALLFLSCFSIVIVRGSINGFRSWLGR